MVDYAAYNNTRKAMVEMIVNKESDITRLDKEIEYLRKSIRLLDIQFIDEMKEKPKHIG